MELEGAEVLSFSEMWNPVLYVWGGGGRAVVDFTELEGELDESTRREV